MSNFKYFLNSTDPELWFPVSTQTVWITESDVQSVTLLYGYSYAVDPAIGSLLWWYLNVSVKTWKRIYQHRLTSHMASVSKLKPCRRLWQPCVTTENFLNGSRASKTYGHNAFQIIHIHTTVINSGRTHTTQHRTHCGAGCGYNPGWRRSHPTVSEMT